MKNKVLLIGWDAADWEIINPLLQAGLMPTLQTLINEGVSGNINTLEPALSPLLWTSIATGKRAYDHGILNFTEPDNDLTTPGIRPVRVTSRKVKALWNILSQNNFKTNVVGWWPSHPAESVNGIYVSNFFPYSKSDNDGEVILVPDCIHPHESSESFKELLVESSEITAEILYPFVPGLNNLNEEHRKPLHALAKILSYTASIHAAATWCMEQNEWDLTCVYFEGIDLVSHNFMKFHPPLLKFIPDEYYAAYKHVVNATYRFHDMMLERYLELAGNDATIIVMSDHGFHSGNQRQHHLPKEPSSPAHEHRQQGILVMKGPDLKKGQQLFGTSLLDITPTILHAMGLPVGKDMEGRVIREAFVEAGEVSYIPSWESIPGNSGMHPPEVQMNPWAEHIALQQLMDLGYIEAPVENLKDRVDTCVNESSYNLAQSYMDGGKPQIARPILEQLYNHKPDQIRFGLKLVECLMSCNKLQSAEILLDKISESGLNNIYDLETFSVLLEMNKGNTEKCLLKLQEIIKSNEKNHFAYYLMGKCKMKLNKVGDAETDFLKALSMNENNTSYIFGYARCCFAIDRYEECIALCMEVIRLNFLIPNAHHLLGDALYKTGKFSDAITAYELVLSMISSHAGARLKLIDIYSNHISNPTNLAVQKDYLDKHNNQCIYVVSGLPRSGTSLLMQILKAGGAELLTDEIRTADHNNINGYFEYEPVKRISADTGWLTNALGKVIKVVAQNLFYLPSHFRYKVLFIHRDLHEVLHSQHVMLGKAHHSKPFNYPILLGEAFNKTLMKVEQLKLQPHIELLEVNHQDIIGKNQEVIEKIKNFTLLDLDTVKMKQVIDESLYRSRFYMANPK